MEDKYVCRYQDFRVCEYAGLCPNNDEDIYALPESCGVKTQASRIVDSKSLDLFFEDMKEGIRG